MARALLYLGVALVLVLSAAVARADPEATTPDDAWVEKLRALDADKNRRREELPRALAAATASQRGRYEYLYYQAVSHYLANAVLAGEAFGTATLQAMAADGYPQAAQAAVKGRLESARKDALKRLELAPRVERPKPQGSGGIISTGYEKALADILRDARPEQLERLRQAMDAEARGPAQ